jgi:hypothetical protein
MLTRRSVVLPLLLASAVSAAVAWPFAAEAAPEQRVSGPYTHENLTIYLIHGPCEPGPVPLTLAEALDKGNVKIHETGTVSELEIENVGDEEVFVHAGDIVKGGQQDRVVTATMIMKGKSGRLPLSVFCVESGRWTARGGEDAKGFASVTEMMPLREAKLAMKAPYAVAAASPAAPDGSPNAAARPPENELGPALSAQRADPRLPAPQPAPVSPDAQSEVWRSVSNIQAALSNRLGDKVAAKESETSLQLALENKKLAEARSRYTDALEPAARTESDVVGYVFAINGKLNSADILCLEYALPQAVAASHQGRRDGSAERGKGAAESPRSIGQGGRGIPANGVGGHAE